MSNQPVNAVDVPRGAINADKNIPLQDNVLQILAAAESLVQQANRRGETAVFRARRWKTILFNNQHQAHLVKKTAHINCSLPNKMLQCGHSIINNEPENF